MNCTPLPLHIGHGFVAQEDLSDFQGYKNESKGFYNNYHFTLDNYQWPLGVDYLDNKSIDGFSPNLNKKLHIGHLRNFCLANSVGRITKAKMVAILGKALGVDEEAKQELFALFNEHNYFPNIFYDLDLFEPTIKLIEHEDGHFTFNNVVVIRSNGIPTYSYHELAFAEHVAPDYYITGAEQVEHFKDLGLGDKHLPMGLVLGEDGKKIKSRSGDALLLTEALQMIENALDETPYKKQIAWNIACCNLLFANRSTNVKLNVDNWVNPATPGMYITYTYARFMNALDSEGNISAITEEHLPLLSQCSYSNYYLQQAINKLDSAPIAQYAQSLAKSMNTIYNKGEKIKGGHPGFVYSVFTATKTLRLCMKLLGMHILEKV